MKENIRQYVTIKNKAIKTINESDIDDEIKHFIIQAINEYTFFEYMEGLIKLLEEYDRISNKPITEDEEKIILKY